MNSKDDFKDNVSPIFERLKKTLQFKEYLKDAIDDLNNKLNKVDIDEAFIKKEILPLINRIAKIIGYIDNAKMLTDTSDITVQALINLSNSPELEKLKNKFYFLQNKLSGMKNKIKLKNKEDNENDSGELWWNKLDEQQDKSAEILERTRKNENIK